MRERLLALAEQRARLVARAQAERESMHVLLAPVDAAASMASSVIRAASNALDQAARHPLIAIAGVALLVALRPRRVIFLLAKGWSLWRFYRSAQGWLLHFAATAGAQPGAPR